MVTCVTNGMSLNGDVNKHRGWEGKGGFGGAKSAKEGRVPESCFIDKLIDHSASFR